MSDVAIVGIGIHPFGRHDLTGMEQGAVAVRGALADAGIGWSDVQFAFGGSDAAGKADTMVSTLGLTGVPFINVANGCATGGSALISAYNAINAGAADVVMAIGFDKHPRGAFDPNPADWGLGQWYGDTGLMLTTQFFGMKIQRYMHEHGIIVEHAGQGRGQGLPQRFAERERLAAQAALGGGDARAAPMLSHPLTQYMFCSPGEGGVALVLCRADLADRFADRSGVPAGRGAAQPAVRQRSRCSARGWRAERGPSPTVGAAERGLRDGRHRARTRSTWCRCRTPSPAPRSCTWPSAASCEDGEQEDLIQLGETEIGGRLPVNTDGGCLANGEPIGASGLRQVYESRAPAARRRRRSARCPTSPGRRSPTCTARPGISACTVLST